MVGKGPGKKEGVLRIAGFFFSLSLVFVIKSVRVCFCMFVYGSIFGLFRNTYTRSIKYMPAVRSTRTVGWVGGCGLSTSHARVLV